MAETAGKQGKREWREYLHYLIPTIIGSISHTIYCLADVFFVSRGVGELGLAALNVALPVFTLYTTFSMMIGVGAATTVSVCRGTGDRKGANRSFTLATVLGLGTGVTIALFGSLFLAPLSRLFGATEELLPYVTAYLRPISAMSFVYIFSSTMTVIVRADGAPRLVMLAGTVGNLANVILDYVFVMPLGWGIFGAGLATAIGPCLTVGILSLHFLRHANSVHFARRVFSLRRRGRILRNGLGSSILELSAGMVILLFNVVLLRVSGPGAVAVFSVISNIAYVGKGIFNGMAQAAQPMISVAYGAGDFQRLQKANRCALIVAGVFSLAVAGIIFLFPREILRLFLSDETLLTQGVPAARLYFLSFVFTAINTILMYYFQSLERPGYTMAIALLKGIVLVFAGLNVLPLFLGETGVWITLLIAEGITFLLFFPQMFPFERKLRRQMAAKEKTGAE